MNSLKDLLRAQNLINTTVQEKTVSVGATPVQVLDNNPNRVSYLISNTSANTVNLGISASLLTTAIGIPLGGSLSLGNDYLKEMDAVGYELWAVSNTGTNTLYVREVVGVPVSSNA